jgi:hypothetical protein
MNLADAKKHIHELEEKIRILEYEKASILSGVLVPRERCCAEINEGEAKCKHDFYLHPNGNVYCPKCGKTRNPS